MDKLWLGLVIASRSGAQAFLGGGSRVRRSRSFLLPFLLSIDAPARLQLRQRYPTMRKNTLLVFAAAISSAAVEVPVTFEPEGNEFTARAGPLAARLGGGRADLELGSEAERISLRLLGARSPAGQGEQLLPSVANYYPGADPATWRVGVPQFARVRFAAVYPGIDALYYGNERSLEYDFVVAAGADPSVIRIAFEGARSVRLTRDGDIAVAAASRELLQRKPVAFQSIHGRRVPVAASYRLRGREARIELGRYDKSQPLMIDPLLMFRLDSHGEERQIATDATGAIYVLTGSNQATVRKYSSAGALIYTTSFAKERADFPARAMAVDGNGSVHLAGVTANPNFLLVNAFRTQFAGPSESFLVRLSPSGTITLSSLIATVTPDQYYPYTDTAVAATADGTTYVAGKHATGTFTKINAQNNTADSTVYVVKVGPSGTRLWATLLPAFQNINWQVSRLFIAAVTGGATVAGSFNCPAVIFQSEETFPQCGGPSVRGTFVSGVGEQGGVSQIRFSKVYADSNNTASTLYTNAFPAALLGSGNDTFLVRGFGEIRDNLTWQWILTKLDAAGRETAARNLSLSGDIVGQFDGRSIFGRFSLLLTTGGDLMMGGIDQVGGLAAFAMRFTSDLGTRVGSFYSRVQSSGIFLAHADPQGALYVISHGFIDKVVPLAGESGFGNLPSQVTVLRPAARESVASPVRVDWTSSPGAQTYEVEALFAGQGIGGGIIAGGLAASKRVPGATTSTDIAVPPFHTNTYMVRVRACGASFDYVNCSPFSSQVPFFATSTQPVVRITNPLPGEVVRQSTIPLRWDPVPGAASYEMHLYRTGLSFVSDTFPASILEAPYSLPSGAYRMVVNGIATTFSVNLGPIPDVPPVITSANVSGSTLTVAFDPVAGADLYLVQVVQAGAGPGGGALSVAAKMVSATPALLTVPRGAASVLVSACNADGCGPLSRAFPVSVTSPSPTAPIVGTPPAGTIVNGPTVFFSWNRIPGDSGSNTAYRLYVQDMARGRPVLDVYTADNFWAANLRSGVRYDVLVIANPGPGQTQGAANGFVVKGPQILSPGATHPGYQQVVRLGAATANLAFEWTPLDLAAADYYEYFISSDGSSPQRLTGQTRDNLIQLPVFAGRNYTGEVRRCSVVRGDVTCGPWSVEGGTGPFRFSTVQ